MRNADARYRPDGATAKPSRGVAAWAVLALLALLVLLALPIAASPASASATDCLSYGYACTPGYTGGNAAGTWAWTYYGGSYAQTPNGYHNCTLYAAWRLQQAGLGNPGRSWGNAAQWAGRIGGGNHTPAVGSIAWWGSEVGGGFGHVAYVEQVSGGNVFIRADNWSPTRGFTNAGWIAASSVDLFLHPHDLSNGSYSDGTFVRTPDGRVWRIAGGAPLYINSWDPFGGPKPVVNVPDLSGLRPFPADGTWLVGAETGRVYRVAGGAPLYINSWAPFGPQPTVAVNQWSIDNGALGHLRPFPADGTWLVGAETGRVYRVAGGAPLYINSWAPFGPQPTVAVNQWSITTAPWATCGSTRPTGPSCRAFHPAPIGGSRPAAARAPRQPPEQSP
jgi:surface antigen